MDAASLTCFCQVRELSYVEQTIQGGIKGAWFETRKRERKFFPDTEIASFTKDVKEHQIPRVAYGTFTS